MANRLANAVSPYLRSHADNPVNWRPWGEDAFSEARLRDVPLFVSIGYSTCHWCHVMARESFSDPELAGYLNDRFVAVKVDREEHPEVDSAYLAAAAAFTPNLGWPLTVFTTPRGRVFYAGTYYPPRPQGGHPGFRQVLEAVEDAWLNRRGDVEQASDHIADALAEAAAVPDVGELPGTAEVRSLAGALAGYEDREFGGFGSAPKFPVAPVLGFLLAPASAPDEQSVALAHRTLERMAASPLRDPVEGGFFRYATRRDWSDPHYERMLYDNAGLLDVASTLWQRVDDDPEWLAQTATGLAGFLTSVMQLRSGAFAAAQDSESTVDGERTEGGYYRLDADARSRQSAPRLDEKVLTGWNGLAIGALSDAGFAFDRPAWIAAAGRAADYLLQHHWREDGSLVRASLDGHTSEARATLEDYGMLAGGLARLALAAGEPRYAESARELVDTIMTRSTAEDAPPFVVPEGPDPVLAARGLALDADPSEGAYPSGLSASADAAHLIYLLTGDAEYRDAARRAVARVATPAQADPIGFGMALRLAAELAAEPVQLVVVGPAAATDDALGRVARRLPATVACVVDDATASRFAAVGFELFTGKQVLDGRLTAYLCRDFACRLPTTDPRALSAPSGPYGGEFP